MSARKSYDAFISYAHDADGAFAPIVRRGLQRLAKPWNRRRAIEVFLDETSLAVSPGLWASVKDALDASQWFVLLASPEAARSHWVGEEISYWVSRKGTDHLLVVVTEGTWVWDDGNGGPSLTGTACIPALQSVLRAEPKHLDMTWARRDASVTLRDRRFRDQIATLAAAIRDVPKDELEGEDIRQQRRTRRVVRSAIAAFTVLSVGLAVLASTVFSLHSKEAATSLAAESEAFDDQANRALTNHDPGAAMEFAVQAERLNPKSPQARAVLLGLQSQSYLGRLAPGTKDGIDGVAFSPDGRTIATSGDDLRLWDSATHKQVATRDPNSRAEILCVAFSPAGHLLASGQPGGVRLWNVDDRVRPRSAGVLAVPGGTQITQVRFSPDGRELAAGGDNGRVWLWDVARAAMIGTFTVQAGRLAAIPGGVQAVVAGLAFTPDGGTVIAAINAGTVRFYNVRDRRTAGTLPTASASANSILAGALAVSGDGRLLATAAGPRTTDVTVQVWNLATRRLMARLPGEPIGDDIFQLAFSPDASVLAAGDLSGQVRLWLLPSEKLPAGKLAATFSGHTQPVTALAFSPDGRVLAAADGDGTATLWSVLGNTIDGYADPITALFHGLAFSPDGRALAIQTGAGQVTFYALPSRRRLFSLTSPFPGAGNITALTFSRDGRRLAMALDPGTADPTVQLWDVARRRLAGDIRTHFGSFVASVAFSPNGALIAASGIEDPVVKVWNTASRALVRTLAENAGPVPGIFSVAFSPNGRALAASEIGGYLEFWDAKTFARAGELHDARSREVFMMAFSPDDSVVVTGDIDGSLGIWDLGRAREITSLNGGSRMIMGLAFAGGGRTLAAREPGRRRAALVPQ